MSKIMKLVQPKDHAEVCDILADAKAADLIEVVIVGFRRDGTEYFGASCADGADALYHLQRASHKLMTMVPQS